MLFPFLWINLSKWMDYPTLSTFYWVSLGGWNCKQLMLDLNQFLLQVNASLNLQLDEGVLITRYSYQTGGLQRTLEFIACDSDTLRKVLDGKSLFILKANSRNCCNNIPNVKYISVDADTCEIEAFSLTSPTFKLIFAENIMDDKIWNGVQCNSGGSSERMIIFGDKEKMNLERIEDKFKNEIGVELNQYPITLNELSCSARKMVFTKGRLCIQGRFVNIKNILPGPNTLKWGSGVTGELLNKLLRNEQPMLFREYQLPKCESVYLERRLLLEGVPLPHPNNKSVEFLESELIMELCSSYGESPRPIFFVAQPGWGKSQLLVSLGNQLIKTSLVIIVSMEKFIKSFGGKETDMKLKLKAFVKEILRCKDNSEEWILDKWLEQPDHKYERIELLLDGLDELTRENKELALKVLQFIYKNFPVIRLWVTPREQFPSESVLGFSYISAKIVPFSRDDQVQFFYACWGNQKLSKEKLKCLANEFVSQFWKQVEKDLYTESATIPLHCRMLADLFEGTVVDLCSPSESNSSRQALSTMLKSEMYENLLNKKLFVYFREKKGILLESNDPDLKLLKETWFKRQTYLALKLLFPKMAREMAFQESEADLGKLGEDFRRVGITSSVNPLIFIHRTFAEYLVARFVYKVLKQGDMMNGVCLEEQVFHDLLFRILEFDNDHVDFSLIFPVICNFLNELLFRKVTLGWLKNHNKYTPKWDNDFVMTDYLEIMMRFKFWNFALLILKIWVYDPSYDFFLATITTSRRSGIPLNVFEEMFDIFGFGLKRKLKLRADQCYKIFESALEYGMYEIAKLLIIEWFPPVQMQNSKTCCNFEVFKMEGDDLNSKDSMGCTILHYCVKYVHDHFYIQLLVELGCQISIKNEKGQCVLCVAVQGNKTEVAKLLHEMMKRFNESVCYDCKLGMNKLMEIEKLNI